MPSPSICMSTVYMSRTLPLLLLLHYIDQTLSERIFISFFTARATLFPLLIVITGKYSEIVFLFSLFVGLNRNYDDYAMKIDIASRKNSKLQGRKKFIALIFVQKV